ncbi:MAG TPA: tyrosine-type recombinase/integrase [Polyangiaceae bacterium]|nr:tyrosine-type recombinase/integrase [Polyangiaceae bacterium]
MTHLIQGTKGVAGLGEYFLDEIRPAHLSQWRDGIAGLIDKGEYEPTTINGWLSILRVIFKAATWKFQLAKNPMDGIENFDTSDHTTYTEEEPNSLTAEEAKAFLTCLQEVYPQHFAMTYLSLATGLRPSSLRPLRRSGSHADVQWDKATLLVRRSQTIGKEVMKKTKTALRQTIALPKEVMDVLRWHVSTQLTTPEQLASELLFPSVIGGFRSPSVLNKPFADVAERVSLGKKFSQRGLRRTFNDLARHAKVEDIVKKSISGHLTDAMVERYSTVQQDEQRNGIGRVLTLVEGAPANDPVPSGAPTGAPGSSGGAP